MPLRHRWLRCGQPFLRPIQSFRIPYRTISSTTMSNRATFLDSAKGKFAVRDAEIGEPGKGEVLVKIRAVGIQPADAKVARLAILPLEYPSVLGGPIAGTVETLGPGVTKVAVGERVACGTKYLVHKKPKYGGFQRYTVVDESEIVEIGDAQFDQAIALQSCTPPAALFGALKLPHPTLPPTPLPASEQGKKIVIWGGSSAMGALSISYAKRAGYTVISTASPKNLDLLRSLGADHVFDHSSPETIGQIRDLFPIDYWFDTISLPSTLSTIVKILAPEGKPVTKAHVLLLLPLSMPGMPKLPEGITAQMHRFSTHSPENQDWAEWFLSRGGYLECSLKEGLIQGVPPETIGGLDKVEEGIDMVFKGVSAKKIVIDPWL